MSELNTSTIEFLFKDSLVQAGHSPILEHVDMEGPDGETIHLCWDDQETSEQDSINIPHDNLNRARLDDEGNKLLVEDEHGKTIAVMFYESHPIDLDAAFE